MIVSYLKLFLTALIPAVATGVLYRFDKASKLSARIKQIIFGIVFGGIAVLGTEFGIPMDGAILNCRDAAPICAGFFFGTPAGIIAGLIGGIERWFAVYWQPNAEYTRLACTISTILAGVIAGMLRKHVFESRRPKLLFSGVCAFLVETMHQSMVFFFHMDDAAKAARIVRTAAPPMLAATTLAVLAAGLVYSFFDGTTTRDKNELTPISIKLERSLLVSVCITFAFIMFFTYKLQVNVAVNSTDQSIVLQLDSLVRTLDKLTGTLKKDELEIVLTGVQPGFSGSLLIIDKEDRTLISGNGVTPDQTFTEKDHPENTPFFISLGGEQNRAVWRATKDYILLLAVPESVLYAVPNISMPAISFVQLLTYGVLFAQIYILMRRTFVKSLNGVSASLEKIALGDLTTRVNERSSSEFAELSDAINRTVEQLSSVIAEKQSSYERDLSVAYDIQLSALPNNFSACSDRGDMDIFALTQPAREVGGDFYDFYFTNNGHFYILVADVSGKGIPAAMFMMRAKTYLKTMAESGKSINEVLSACNELICKSNNADMFITAWIADIDMLTGRASFVNAGHNPPLAALKSEGVFSYLKTKPCFILGGMTGMEYRKEDIQLTCGDRLLLYTDGITEAQNENNELFGEERLINLVNENKGLSAKQLVNKVRDEVMVFTGTADQFDDITLLVFDYKASEYQREIHFDAVKGNMPAATAFLEEMLERADCPSKLISQLDIVLDEILANITKYAYANAEEPGMISFRIDYADNPRGVKLTIQDQGIPFNPLKAREPDITLSAAERNIGGLGIYLARKLTDSMTYEYKDGNNTLILTKTF